ncbi:MAG: hypothetical protein OXP69_06175 [Spirochaetaceae bacterium]|nr:hypothetical protein [Spirochaetaceae bacterium]
MTPVDGGLGDHRRCGLLDHHGAGAGVLLTIGPIVPVHPFIQKYFVKGIMLGAIKG